MSIFLTTFTFSSISKPRARSGDFFSRALPLTISFTCAAGSPAPQAEKFSLSVHLWVKCKQKSESMTPLTIFLTRVFGVFWCLSQDDSLLLRLCSLLPRRQYAHKNHCPAHSVLISPPRDHLWQLFYPGWLLHAKALQDSVSRLAASIVFTFTNTILKTKIL